MSYIIEFSSTLQDNIKNCNVIIFLAAISVQLPRY